jgi:hypothetical protein
MALKLGNDEVTKVMLGSGEVSAVYKGTEEVWTSAPEPIENVRLLLIGGGGGGGLGSSSNVGGGGGAGGYLEGTTSKLLKGVKYTVEVGLGGSGDTRLSREGIDDQTWSRFIIEGLDPSVIFGLEGGTSKIISPDGKTLAMAQGGGRGRGAQSGSYAGSSTGGGDLYTGPESSNVNNVRFHHEMEATGVLMQVHTGGSGHTASSNSGGGGGAGQGGQNATSSRGGYGGNGLASDITGTSEYYAGGGGGGTDNYANGSGSPSRGGQGGGGAGAWWSTTVPAIRGTDYFGGGGGGGVGGSGTNSLTRAGAAGGQGAVYIKTEANFTFTGAYDVMNATPGSKAYRLKSAGDLYLG